MCPYDLFSNTFYIITSTICLVKWAYIIKIVEVYGPSFITLYMNILSNSYDVIVLKETWLVGDIMDIEFIDDRWSRSLFYR